MNNDTAILTYLEELRQEVDDLGPDTGNGLTERLEKYGIKSPNPPTGRMWIRHYLLHKSVKKHCRVCGKRASWQIGQHRSNGEMTSWYTCDEHRGSP